jgi:ATP-dependent Lhr-like helicase
LQLVARWGIVARELAGHESLNIAWRDVLWAYRRLEARGVIRGGHFVAGIAGEQYGSPEAVELLRSVASKEHDGSTVRISAADPLNLTGVVLPGPRVPGVRGRDIVLCDGLVLRDDTSLSGGPIRRRGPGPTGTTNRAVSRRSGPGFASA